MVEYEKISIKDLKNIRVKDNKVGDIVVSEKFYEVKGIPRGIRLNEHNNIIDRDYSYELGFYLQDEKEILKIYLSTHDLLPERNTSLLKAASEGNLEATVRGFIDAWDGEGRPCKLSCHLLQPEGTNLVEVSGYTIKCKKST